MRDSTLNDTGTEDTGAGDTGAVDTGMGDIGTGDTGTDSGIPDAGTTDAGPDSGVADSGTDGGTDSGPSFRWTQSNFGFHRYGHSTVVFKDRLWVIGGIYQDINLVPLSSNDVWNSADGITWTQVKPNNANGFPARDHHTSTVHDGKMWVIGGGVQTDRDNRKLFNDVWYSTDGVGWTQAKPDDTNGFSPREGLSSVEFGGKLWVTAGQWEDGQLNDVWFSQDGSSWEAAVEDGAPGFTPRTGHTSVVFDNKIWVIAGYWANGGPRNDVWMSTDGITWEQAKPNDLAGFANRYEHSSVVFGGELWVIGGWKYDKTAEKFLNFSDVWSSVNGVDWVRRKADDASAFAGRFGHTSAAHGGNLWVISGYDVKDTSQNFYGDVWRSSNGVDWTKTKPDAVYSFIPRLGHAGMVMNGRMWVAGGASLLGYANDVWSSTDGVYWDKVKNNDGSGFPGRAYHGGLVFKDAMWVLYGMWSDLKTGDKHYMADVWSSTDGMTWEQKKPDDAAAFSPRYAASAVVFDEKMWVIAGRDGEKPNNDVWYSADGVNWTQAKPNDANGFSPRYGHTSVVRGDRMWVMGGSDGEASLNDVWYSYDGASWEQARPSNSDGFPARVFHASVVWDDRMRVIGGSYMKDAWYSFDGSEWVEANPNDESGFSGRSFHSSVVFADRMWVMGGFDYGQGAESLPLGDVWFASWGR
ncbi:MAG: kelch repeat-containing protein [Myxococcota bacterium]